MQGLAKAVEVSSMDRKDEREEPTQQKPAMLIEIPQTVRATI